MEVLSVQNQYQGQFGVIGSSKVKDWTSPLTPPPPPPPLPPSSSATAAATTTTTATQLTTSNNYTSDNVAYNQRNGKSNHSDCDQIEITRGEEEEQQQQQHVQLYGEDAAGEGVDCVDGGNWSAPQKLDHHQIQHNYNHHYYQQGQQQQQQQQQHHFYYNNHHYGGINNTNIHHQHDYHHHHQQQQQQQQQHNHHANNYHQHYQSKDQQQYNQQLLYTEQQQQQQPQQYKNKQQQQKSQAQKQQQINQSNSKQPAMEATYNNNMFYYEPSVVSSITPNGTPTSGSCFGSATTDVDIAAVNELAQRVQTELRDAKKRHLDCTEVSLPYDLMPRIAAEIIKASEREPRGVRGCSLYIDFECDPNNIRRIASFKVDDCTVSTFELYLTLKQDKSGWTSLLPQFIKNLTRSNTILISPDFTLTKNKLYSCD